MRDPWLHIIGLSGDGLDGLSPASRDAISKAEFVFGGPRHLGLVNVGDRGRLWPVPFSIAPVLALRGRRVVVLASGDPFWFGAGRGLAAALASTEWCATPAPSTFSLAASRLGWPLEDTICLGLHAAPPETVLQHLAPDRRLICLVRDGEAVGTLAAWLTKQGFGASLLWVLEALGGPHERIRNVVASGYALVDVAAPVAVAIRAAGGAGLPRAAGLSDDAFEHDGQITKRPVRALTLSALAPRAGELLWDIGAGSGSISIEWCLAGGRAIGIEPRPDRVLNMRKNAATYGVTHRFEIVAGAASAALEGLEPPHAVFIGGGLDAALIDWLWTRLASGTRLVANAVTLETERQLLVEHSRRGGELLRIDLAQAAPLGSKHGWLPSRPIIQWSVET